MTKKRLFDVVVACVLVALCATQSPAQAPGLEITGNVAIASDYAFRGISQTLEKPAIQGGLDVSGPFALYGGLWGSSVNFGEDLSAGARAQMELDAYAGIAPSLAGFDFDAGVLYYAYPGAAAGRSYDFVEVYGGISRELGMFSLGLEGAYSPDFFAGSGTALFGAFTGSATLPMAPVSIDGTVGRQAMDENAAFGAPDYTYWSFGVSSELLGTSIGGSVVGTDLDESTCFGGSDLCATRAIVSVSRAL